jgi:hypothetical protein
MNIIVIIKRGAFYYENINLSAETMSAEFSVELIKRRL